jgi:predicted RNase H-like HicB family nuclease
MSKYGIFIYWSEVDKKFLAEAPELPGCMADGQSYLEAARNIETVIEEWIETAQMLGREIPIPKGKLRYA